MHRLSSGMILAFFVAVVPVHAQSKSSAAPPDQPELTRSAEMFVRNLFTWGPDYKVKIGALGPSPSPGFYSFPIEVTYRGRTEGATFFISKDGKTFIRGEMYDVAADPFAVNRGKLHTAGNPSTGPADSPVTIVEFADFECPHCREIHDVLKSVERDYPQVRLVFKDFPLPQLHPWAETAATAGRCAFQQSPPAFWKMYDMIFNNQDSITPENVFDRLTVFAGQIGVNTDQFKACMASPEAKRAVAANREDGVALDVNSTPTLFINGRPLIGGDLESIEDSIKYVLGQKTPR